MNSVAERVTSVRNRNERLGICSHCGYYERDPNEKPGDSPGDYIAGAVKSKAKYRIIM